MKNIVINLVLLSVTSAMFTACGDGTSSGVSSNGTLVKGEFTVAPGGRKVYFSRGNLQYQASTNTWRFAENQWDMIGEDNENISPNYDGWIDLFGWGTSGFNGKNPYMTSKERADYGDGENDIARTNYDWGVYNKISNGGNNAGMWRTLTISEWEYILHGRPHGGNLWSKGRVDGIEGLILLPDEWDYSIGFSPRSEGWKTNDYTLDEWSIMEAHGAVFLPAAGYRGGTDVNYVGFDGRYWSSSAGDSYGASYLGFYGYEVYTYNYGDRDYGHSVRLVRDAK